MIKYAIVTLIVLYIYNTYISPISESVKRSRYNDLMRRQSNQSPKPNPKPHPSEYVDYEEIKD
jgi:hypothetical protein